MLRYEFGESLPPIESSAYAKAHEHADPEEVAKHLHEQTVGQSLLVKTPFGRRRVLYADYTASGRSLRPVEDFIQRYVLPFYGNTHTLTSSTARQTTFFRNEARHIIKNAVNACYEDAAIFCGAGTTGAVHKFVEVLCRSNFAIEDDTDAKDPYFKDDRWGGCECSLCGIRMKNEHIYRAHQFSEIHAANLAKLHPAGSPAAKPARRRVIILCDPIAHHSSSLPFRELAKRYPLSDCPVIEDSLYTSGSDPRGQPQRAPGGGMDVPDVEVEVSTIALDHATGMLSEADFEQKLMAARGFAEGAQGRDSDEPAPSVRVFCLLAAASNVSGVRADVPAMTRLVHRYKGIACWDYAALASHEHVDLNPPNDPDAAVDVAFFSPHKLLGGPDSSGLLLAKKRVLCNAIPSVTGGGVVFFVDAKSHSYIQNVEEREEAGTPGIVACIRAGLAFHFHSMLPPALFEREAEAALALARRWQHHPRIHLLGPIQQAAAGPPGQGQQQQVAIISFLVSYGNEVEAGDGGAGSGSAGLYLHHNFVTAVLNDLFGVQSRGGCACAGPYSQFLMGLDDRLSADFERCLTLTGHEVLRPGAARVGPHFTMASGELELLARAVLWVADHAWRLLPAYDFVIETGEWSHRLDAPQQGRRWLSSMPLVGRGMESDLQKLEDGIAEGKGDHGAPDSVEAAIAAADEAARLQFATSEVNLKDAQRGHQLLQEPQSRRLLWFALPADAASSLKLGVPGLDLEAGRGDADDRPRRAIFVVKDFRDRHAQGTAEEAVPPPEECGDTEVAPDGLLDDIFCLDVLDQAEDGGGEEAPPSSAAVPMEGTRPKFSSSALRPKIPKPLRSLVGSAIGTFGMIKRDDRLLVGLSGGKDSLTMLHSLLDVRRRAEAKFTIAAATVDPMTPEFRPEPMREYLAALGVEYHMLSQPLIQMAKCHIDPKKPSICSFCSRMKRGMLYSCMREHGYNVLCLGQHLDDFAESFVMSCFQNGLLRTMKANYYVEKGDVRVVRPLVFVRERVMADFALENKLPVIADNCPACFQAPKERHRTKLFLSAQEFENPNLFPCLLNAMMPLIGITHADRQMDWFRHLGGSGKAQDDEDDDGEGFNGSASKAPGKPASVESAAGCCKEAEPIPSGPPQRLNAMLICYAAVVTVAALVLARRRC